MRRLVPLGLGLAFAFPAISQAGGPGSVTHHHHVANHCSSCVSHMPKRIPANAHGVPLNGSVMPAAGPVISSAPGGCTSCEAGSSEVIYPTAPEGAGMAFVGGGEAPGYASVGMTGSNEPAPVGVMRTNYQTTAGSNYNGLPMGATPMAAGPYGGPSALPPTAAQLPWGQAPVGMGRSASRPPRARVLAHLLGLRMPRFGAAREARERAEHAAIRYDNSATIPSELPASMVYDGNH